MPGQWAELEGARKALSEARTEGAANALEPERESARCAVLSTEASSLRDAMLAQQREVEGLVASLTKALSMGEMVKAGGGEADGAL